MSVSAYIPHFLQEKWVCLMYPLGFPPSLLTYIITFTLHPSILVFSLLLLHIRINLSYFALYFLFSPRCFYQVSFLKIAFLGFLGGSVVRNPLANAGDTGLIPDPGRFHMPRSNYARVPQSLSLCSRDQNPQLLSPRAATTEPTCCNYWAHALQLLSPRAAATEAQVP